MRMAFFRAFVLLVQHRWLMFTVSDLFYLRRLRVRSPFDHPVSFNFSA